MQKHVNLVDLVKSFPTNIFLQNLASIQKRPSPMKFAHLSEKSEEGSISNLSTKAEAAEKKEEAPAENTPGNTSLTQTDRVGTLSSMQSSERSAARHFSRTQSPLAEDK